MMEGLVRKYRRGLAFMLAAAMVAVNILTGATSAYAADTPEETPEATAVVCELDKEAVKAAIEAAVKEHGAAADGSEEGEDGADGKVYPLEGVTASLTPSVDGVNAELLYDAAANVVIVRVTNTGETSLTFTVKAGSFESKSVTVDGVSAADGTGESGGEGETSGESESSGTPETTAPSVATPGNGTEEISGDSGLIVETAPAEPTGAPEMGETQESESETAPTEGTSEPAEAPETGETQESESETAPTEGTSEPTGTPETSEADPNNGITTIGGGLGNEIPGAGDETEAKTVAEVKISGEVFGYKGVAAAGAVTLTIDGESQGFDTLQKAIDAIAAAGDNAGEASITVNQDLSDVTVKAKDIGSLTLDLNEHTLTLASGVADPIDFEIGKEDTICIRNGSIKGGAVTNHAIYVSGIREVIDPKSHAFRVYSGGAFQLERVIISDFEVSGGMDDVVYLSNILDVDISYCTFEDNSGSVINCSASRDVTSKTQIIVAECEIRNNTSSNDMVFISMEDVDIENCNFSDNIGGDVGAVTLSGTDETTARITNSRFERNKAKNIGALKLGQEGSGNKEKVVIDGCTFTDNEATNVTAGRTGTGIPGRYSTAKDAGAIANYADMHIKGGTRISGNKSGAHGAIFNFEKLKIEDTVITGNIAVCGDDHSTGGIKSYSSDLWILSGAVFDNYRGNNPTNLSDIMAWNWVQKVLPASEMSAPELGSDIYVWKTVGEWVIKETYENGITPSDKPGGTGDFNIAAVKTETSKAPLTITKAIEGGPENVSEKTFVFDITDDNGYSSTVEITGEGTSEQVYLLPGTYTVTEQAASIEGYLWTAPEAQTVTITDGTPVNVEFTNAYALPGSLTIKTAIDFAPKAEGESEDGPDTSKLKFSFTVEGVDNGFKATEVNTDESGVAKLEGLLPGTYTVTENIKYKSAELTGYVLEDPGVQTVEVIGGKDAAVEIKNTYKPEPKGSVHIKFIVEGDLPEEAIPKKFSVRYREVTGGSPETVYFIPAPGEREWEVTEQDKPVGEYLVMPQSQTGLSNAVKADVPGYTRKENVKVNGVDTTTAEVKENQTTEVVITFTYTKHPVRIGQTTYESLAEAFDAVPYDEKTEVFLLKDIELDSTVALEEEKYVKLISDEGGPYTIKRSAGFEKYLLTVEEGAELTLGNVVFDGGSDEGLKATQSLIKVEKYAALTITDGAVLQNNDCQEELSSGVGGVPTTGYDHNGGGVLCQGTLVMTGGTIKNCKANNGGGIMIASYDDPDDAASFEMSNGIISGNAAYYKEKKDYGYNVGAGGGVVLFNASRMKFTGGEISGNTAGVGGGISVGTECSLNYAGDREYHLEMTGGTVNGNKADGNGGGIFIAGAAFGALIRAGRITNNVCALDPVSYTVNHRPAYYGGGGIYVHGDTGETGHLQVYNAQISDNNADIAGGGIAGCPSSSVGVYITDGGVIYGNNDGDSQKAKQEIYVVRDDNSIPMVSISPTMLGGGRYDWTDETGRRMDDSELRVTLDENHSSIATYNELTENDADVQTAKNNVATIITGNVSHSCGGGIGTNGGVSVGTPGPEDAVTSVWIKKDWDIDVKRYPEYITFWLLRDDKRIASAKMKSTSGGKTWAGGAVEFFKGLPANDPDGNPYKYSVEEEFSGLYEVTTNPEATGSESNPWSFTNTQTCSLRITKNAVGGDADAAYGFQITLTNADGTPYNGPVKVVDDDGNELTSPVFTDGKASVTLKSGEVLFLTGLKAGIGYSVEETEDGGAGKTSFTAAYTDCSNIQQSQTAGEGTICEGQTAYGRTDIVFRNEFIETTSVKVQKKWFIDGSAAAAPDGAVITVRLLVNGMAAGASLELSAETGWEGEFVDLPVTDESGQTIVYTVEEEPFEGWASQVSGDAVSGFVVTNAYFTPRLGSLSVTKTLSGDAAEADRTFRFTVTLTPAEGAAINGTFGDMVFADNQAVVELKGGQTAVASGLPAGTVYSVAEDSYPEYTVTYTNENGTIADGETAEVVVNNHRTRPPENPDTPDNPGTPPGDNPPPTPPIENITDEPTPLSSFDRFENIEDEDVPLAFMAPTTGDEAPTGAAALFGLIALGMMGAFGILGLRKDEEDA